MRIKRRRDSILLIEQELFEKILAQIESKNLAIEEAFKQFDTDSNGNIEFHELLNGFQKLGIKVTKNECKAIFAILGKFS